MKYQVRCDGRILEPAVFSDGHREYRIGTGEERGSMKVYEVLPGIEFIYHDFTMQKRRCSLDTSEELLEISYCHKGRAECRWVCGDSLYLGNGDLCITRIEKEEPPMGFPAGYYRGISVVLDLKRLQQDPPPLLNREVLELDCMADKFCPDHHFFAMRANVHIAHIFTELCECSAQADTGHEVPEAIWEDYRKIKVLELLLYLSMVNPSTERRIMRITKGQIDVIKAVRQRICENLSKELTIDQLAREYCISPTALKVNFRVVYNTSVKEYLRKARMEHAAELLRSESMTVGEIARQVGYANQSKFASAFRSLYGITPVEYRKKCSHGGE